MRLQGSTMIRATRERVWQCITDAEQISQCAPGLESYEVIKPDKRFRITARVGFGTMKLKFLIDVEWLDMRAPNPGAPSYGTMTAHGRASGNTVAVTTEMRLIEVAPAQTQLVWSANITLAGTLATMAPQMIGGVANKLATAFFECLKTKVEDCSDLASV